MQFDFSFGNYDYFADDIDFDTVNIERNRTEEIALTIRRCED